MSNRLRSRPATTVWSLRTPNGESPASSRRPRQQDVEALQEPRILEAAVQPGVGPGLGEHRLGFETELGRHRRDGLVDAQHVRGESRIRVVVDPYRRRSCGGHRSPLSCAVMTDDTPQTYGVATAAAVRELLELMRVFEERFSDRGPRAGRRAVRARGYRWIFTIVHVGMQAHFWADAQRPHFVDIVGRYNKWGGDNSDAFYQYAPIDPTKTYRVPGAASRRGLLLAHDLRRSRTTGATRSASSAR